MPIFSDMTAEYVSIYAILEQRVVDSPRDPALFCRELEFSYTELLQQVDRLASYLKAKYPIRGDRCVGVYFPKQPYGTLLCAIALSKLQTNILILGDTELTAEMHSQVSFVLASEHIETKHVPIHIVDLDLDLPDPIEDELDDTAINNNIFVIGCVAEQSYYINVQNIVLTSQQLISNCNITSSCRILHYTPLYHPRAWLDILLAFLSGASLFMGRDLSLGPALMQFIQTNKIDTLVLPAQILNTLPPQALPNLSTIVADDFSQAHLLAQWKPFVKNIYFLHKHQLSRIYISITDCQQLPVFDIGKPIVGIQFLQKNSILEVKGLCTPSMPFGQSFSKDIFYPTDYNLQKTEIVGLVSQQAYAVDLWEIKQILLIYPQMQNVEIMLNQETLFIYFVSQQTIPKTKLEYFLQQNLPQLYKQNLTIELIPIHAFPLTKTGELDYRALENLSIQRQFITLCKNILETDNITSKDDFIASGGDSIRATQIASTVKEKFHVELKITDLLTSRSFESLAQKIKPTNQVSKTTFEKISSDTLTPLSHTQQQIWLVCHQIPDIPVYNEPISIMLNADVDIIALEKSIQLIVQRHSVLRTVFTIKHAQPVQKISNLTKVNLKIKCLSNLKLKEQQTTYLSLAHKQAVKSFDLASDLLLRATLFQFNETKNILLLTIHHLVIDGLSIYQTLLHELHTCYNAFLNNQQPKLPLLTAQYIDFALWQQQQTISDQQRNYWHKQLSNLTFLQLPTDFTYPKQRNYQGKVHFFQLPSALAKQIKLFSHGNNVTLFMTLIATFYVLLHRYTAQQDIAISTVINQRNHAELSNLIGLFLNTLILRVQFDDKADFLTLLKQVKQVALEAYTHQDVSFSEILKYLRTTQKISHNPFNVAFVLEPIASKVDENWSCSLLDVHTGTAKFDLTLQFEDRGNELVGRFEYRTDLFKPSTIQRMAGHFQTLLETVVSHPKIAVCKLPLLTEVERKQFEIWNQTKSDFPQDKCIHQLFEEQVERTPNNIAVVFERQQLTYLELNQKANQLAHYLIEIGIQPEMLVGICINRSLEMVIGLLAILKAGGAYVPLDPHYPPERLNFMIDDAQIKVLLSQKNVLPRLPFISENTTILAVEEWHQAALHSTNNPQSTVQPNNLAYVIYTSGSTGKPKGVLLEHRGACNLSTFQIKHFNIQSDDVILQFSSLSFDAATGDIVMALMSGACLCIPKNNEILVGSTLVDTLVHNRISVATIPPSVVNTISLKNIIEKIKEMRTLIVVGEKFLLDSIAAWSEKDICIINAYGPTESTICATASDCLDNLEKDVTIGHPIANTRLYVLDKNQQQLPVGLVGELYIGGAGVARGYLNRPELTTEKFIINPLSGDENDRLYRTGDLVRFLEDGQLEFVGRIDNQVKIRGFRIELEEIATALKQHDDVKDAVVVIEENKHKQLVAYFVPELSTRRVPFKTTCQLKFDDGLSMATTTENISCYGLGLVGLPVSCSCREQQSLTVQFSLPNVREEIHFEFRAHVVWIKGHRMGITFEQTSNILCDYIDQQIRQHQDKDELHRNSTTLLRQYLTDRLPHYMIPSIFVLLEKMPLTPNGKIDMKSLKEYECSRLNLQLSYMPPNNQLERIITEVWQQALKLDKIGIHESFFDLGGDSLLVVKVQELLEKKLERKLSTTVLFQYPTISVLARYLSGEVPEDLDRPQREYRVAQRKIAHQRRKERHHKKK